MATIQERRSRKGDKSYRVQVRLKGYPAQTATVTRKTDAQKWARKTEADIRDGRYFGRSEARRHTLAEAIDRYIRTVLPEKSDQTQNSQSLQLRWWKEKLGDHLLSDIINGLIAEGFAIRGIWENPRPGNKLPVDMLKAGSESHRDRYIPFGLSVIAQRS